MARTSPNGPPAARHIRQRGGSFQVHVYAGVDPLTGKDHYLTESTRDATEAEKIRTRLLAAGRRAPQPADEGHARRSAGGVVATHEAEETTLEGYRGYVRRTIEPALGELPIAKITPQVLEEFYADLRRCRHRCADGEPAVDHRTAMPARMPDGAASAPARAPGTGAARTARRRAAR